MARAAAAGCKDVARIVGVVSQRFGKIDGRAASSISAFFFPHF